MKCIAVAIAHGDEDPTYTIVAETMQEAANNIKGSMSDDDCDLSEYKILAGQLTHTVTLDAVKIAPIIAPGTPQTASDIFVVDDATK